MGVSLFVVQNKPARNPNCRYLLRLSKNPKSTILIFINYRFHYMRNCQKTLFKDFFDSLYRIVYACNPGDMNLYQIHV